MLQIADRPVSQAIEALANFGTEAAFLVPTETGLEKSIMDAHSSLRSFLRVKGIHDFAKQGQGASQKIVIQATLLKPELSIEIPVALYRPDTKGGDPRIWPHGLKSHVIARNLLALIVIDQKLYIVNLSDRGNLSEDGQVGARLAALLRKAESSLNLVASELLANLREHAGNRWIKTLRPGPTGVGFTLESLLGISANNNKSPDFKGIEIKAGRTKSSRRTTRSTLFSKTPDWMKSRVGSGMRLLEAYGYESGGRRQLYCELSNSPNRLGHYLKVDDSLFALHSMFHDEKTAKSEKVFHWDIEVLQSQLLAKHNETFWIKAKTRGSGGDEEFLFSEVVHTRKPLASNISNLFDLGVITLDYCIHEEVSASGKCSARDHGYLFKIWEKDLNQLFPPPSHYSLLSA
jgi:hypothetical protein